jgi:hypothetical protein
MVDQPKLLLPHQHISVACRAVHIGNKAIEPHDLRSQQRIHFGNGRIEGDGSGKKMQRQVQPGAELQQVLYFFVWLGAAESRINMGKHDLRHLKPSARAISPPISSAIKP